MNTAQTPQAIALTAITVDMERCTTPVIEALRTLAAAQPNPRAQVLLFEYEYGVGDWAFPVSYYALDDEMSSLNPTNAAEVALPDKALFMAYNEQLRSQLPDSEIDGFEFAVIAEWWRRCWLAAGGSHFALPAFIMMHDSTSGIDLNTREEQPTSVFFP